MEAKTMILCVFCGIGWMSCLGTSVQAKAEKNGLVEQRDRLHKEVVALRKDRDFVAALDIEELVNDSIELAKLRVHPCLAAASGR